jgi:hypothetical protein
VRLIPFGDFLPTMLRKAYFQERIRPAKRRRQPGQQILSVDGLPRVGVLFGRQNACRGRDFRAGQLPPHRARSHCHLRIVTNALGLAHLAERHDVKLVTVFAEPYRRRDLLPALAKCRERDVVLAVDGSRDCFGHTDIVAAVAAGSSGPLSD